MNTIRETRENKLVPGLFYLRSKYIRGANTSFEVISSIFTNRDRGKRHHWPEIHEIIVEKIVAFSDWTVQQFISSPFQVLMYNFWETSRTNQLTGSIDIWLTCATLHFIFTSYDQKRELGKFNHAAYDTTNRPQDAPHWKLTCFEQNQTWGNSSWTQHAPHQYQQPTPRRMNTPSDCETVGQCARQVNWGLKKKAEWKFPECTWRNDKTFEPHLSKTLIIGMDQLSYVQ